MAPRERAQRWYTPKSPRDITAPIPMQIALCGKRLHASQPAGAGRAAGRGGASPARPPRNARQRQSARPAVRVRFSALLYRQGIHEASGESCSRFLATDTHKGPQVNSTGCLARGEGQRGVRSSFSRRHGGHVQGRRQLELAHRVDDAMTRGKSGGCVSDRQRALIALKFPFSRSRWTGP